MKQKETEIFIDQYLPHNFLAEKAILTCLLTSSEAIEFVTKVIPVGAFYFKNHQEIYKAVRIMHKDNLPIDFITLTDFLQERGLLEKIGGIQVIAELMSQFPNQIYLEEYIKLIKDKFLKRSLIKLGYDTINTSYISNISVESILDNLKDEIFKLTTGDEKQKVFSNAELLNKIFYELKEKFLNPTLPGLLSGFFELDRLIQGFQKSDLIILAARPSIGKTALSLSIAINAMKETNLPVVFFSIEMSKEQIMYRLLSLETNIDQRQLKNGQLSQNSWIKVNKIIKIISKLPFFVDDTPSLSIQNIRVKIKNVILKEGQIGLVIIDYLQLMQDLTAKKKNRVQELSLITRSLKIIAREFNIPIIALSQLNRNVENRLDQRPVLSDLRESGSIEQDADLVLMLYRTKTLNSDAQTNLDYQIIELIVAKQRNGPLGTIKLKFTDKQAKFSTFDSN